MRLATARLDLVPLTPDDADELFPVLNAPELGRFTGEDPPRDVDVLRRRFELWSTRRSPDRAELCLNWVVRRHDDGRAVGHVQATVGEGDATIAWVIGTADQRRGFATEAGRALIGWLHDALGVLVVNGCIHPDNVASQTAAARIGLRPTDRWYDGEVVWTNGRDGS